MAIPYHATAVKTGNHLIRCLADIDLNIDKETPTELFFLNTITQNSQHPDLQG